jgi:hypothetical protein
MFAMYSLSQSDKTALPPQIDIAEATGLTISELEGFANEQLQILRSQPGNN